MKRLTPAWEQKWGESEKEPGKPSDNNTGLTQSEREREGRKGGGSILGKSIAESLSQSCSPEEPHVP